MNIFSQTLLTLVCLLPVVVIAQKRAAFKPVVVYQSDTLVVTQISQNAFQHTSFLQTDDFGKVPCNGLIVKSEAETIVFDTPPTNSVSDALIRWITGTLHSRINAVIPTHFHTDCLGGLEAFHANNIPSYANFKTLELAKGRGYTVPQKGFSDSLKLSVGTEYITATFFGEGHTIDNVIGYFPSEDILFGGCLIKELGAGKGFLGDANVAAWAGTVRKVKGHYPNVKLIIPGHGKFGNKKLLDYTIKLFKVD